MVHRGPLVWRTRPDRVSARRRRLRAATSLSLSPCPGPERQSGAGGWKFRYCTSPHTAPLHASLTPQPAPQLAARPSRRLEVFMTGRYGPRGHRSRWVVTCGGHCRRKMVQARAEFHSRDRLSRKAAATNPNKTQISRTRHPRSARDSDVRHPHRQGHMPHPTAVVLPTERTHHDRQDAPTFRRALLCRHSRCRGLSLKHQSAAAVELDATLSVRQRAFHC